MPDFEDYSMKGRTYRYMSDPLFPFGFGLSYTTFSIGDARFSKTSNKDESVELTIPVSNTGKRDGTEIVQVYVRQSKRYRWTVKNLKEVSRGLKWLPEKLVRQLLTCLTPHSSSFDRASGKMAVTAGEYEVLYGNSSDAKDLKMHKITIL